MLPHGKTSDFLKKVIRDYYRFRPLEEPGNLHMREIALESLEDRRYIRHLSFPYMEQLYNFIETMKTPLHLYYSSALYSNPSAEEMEAKGWQGSELIFDIDADKYPGCIQRYLVCSKSGVIINDGESCPSGEEPLKYSPVSWECILKAWGDALKLRDILVQDFGFSKVKIYFSGNRGFHVRVMDEEALPLTREQRRLIADYVACSNIDVDRIFPSYKDIVVFRRVEYGLRRRVLELAISRKLVKEKSVAGLRGLIINKSALDELIRENCVKVDKVVTMDTSRLSRFVNSLNMKSGLRVVEVEPTVDLRGKGFTDFSPFHGEVMVKPLVDASQILVLDKFIGLRKGEIIRLEAPYALYLAVNGLVEVRDSSGIGVKL
ncbi:DNA primase small subunit domain-containing protein [Desulfurococcus amylolyticus]|uniref:DNA primase small subunit domain-containing protein n=1 Tax=Desulfurococcus amylolyticus TaxID=94694 RepID=UPI0005B228A8|nr:DNA primase small subunit domain-containing protein [Desulfurococcus amylolyticus]